MLTELLPTERFRVPLGSHSRHVLLLTPLCGAPNPPGFGAVLQRAEAP